MLQLIIDVPIINVTIGYYSRCGKFSLELNPAICQENDDIAQ